MQTELSRAQEDLDLKDKAIKELKKSMSVIVGSDKRDKSKEVEKELIRLVTDNQSLRQHSMQLQRVFQERESELLADIQRLSQGDHLSHDK